MNVYDIEFEGVTIKTTVLDRADLVDTYLSQLQSSLPMPKHVKKTGANVNLLIICVNTQCLIIQFLHIDKVPESLKNFLIDGSNFFVGVRAFQIADFYGRGQSLIQYSVGYECYQLAAEVLKTLSPYVELSDLARVFGVDSIINPILQSGSGDGVDWKARVFSHEQIKYAIRDAYAYFVFGNKLFGML